MIRASKPRIVRTSRYCGSACSNPGCSVGGGKASGSNVCGRGCTDQAKASDIESLYSADAGKVMELRREGKYLIAKILVETPGSKRMVRVKWLGYAEVSIIEFSSLPITN